MQLLTLTSSMFLNSRDCSFLIAAFGSNGCYASLYYDLTSLRLLEVGRRTTEEASSPRLLCATAPTPLELTVFTRCLSS